MALLGKRVAVAVPDTLLEEKDSLKDKTVKLGLVARACAIYGVDRVEVFRDGGGKGEAALITKVLQFLETPQYLRRRLFPLDESLRYAGVLPPLRIPSHKARVPASSLKAGEFREGVSNGDGTVDVGLDEPALVARAPARDGRVTLRIVSNGPLRGEVVSREQVGGYWGYVVKSVGAEEVLTDKSFGLTVATSRLGRPLSEQVGALRRSLAGARGVKLVFGSPSRGLFEIFGRDLARRADFVLNLFPAQQVETVRTEEAVFAGLNLIGVLAAEKA
jgi:methyltransferase